MSITIKHEPLSEKTIRISDQTLVIYEFGKTHTQAFLRKDGRCQYSGKTFTEVQKEYPKCVILQLQHAIKHIRATENKLYIDTIWKEISEDDYMEMLEVLPPENWQGGIFRMCEYWTSNITGHYVELDGKFYTAQRRNTTSYASIRAEIRKQVSEGLIKKAS